jgi:acetyl-CoA carboxylase carboxyl transferase subunit alpha
MLENSVYSVISPEGCAAILWKDSALANKAAEGLKLTARDLHENRLVDEVVKEPEGGGHADVDGTIKQLDEVLYPTLKKLIGMSLPERLRMRRLKMRQMGSWIEG